MTLQPVLSIRNMRERGVPSMAVQLPGVGDVRGAMTVESLALLFSAVTSPPPETVAVLVTVAGALLATLTVMVRAGKNVVSARESERGQGPAGSGQDQPVPDTDVAGRRERPVAWTMSKR